MGGGEIKNEKWRILQWRKYNETTSDVITTTTAVSLKNELILEGIR